MISRYKQVGLEEAGAGAELAADVCDQQGTVLLPAGAALTEALIRALARRGIDTVTLRDDAVAPELLAAERERVGQRLAHLFRHPGQGRADALLRQGLQAYRMEGLE